MAQQGDKTSQDPGAAAGPGTDIGASPGTGQRADGSGLPGTDAAALASLPVPSWPSPYLTQGQAVPEAYPAPPQPGRPRYGSAGGPVRPGQQTGQGQQGYGQPRQGRFGRPGYNRPGSGQRQQGLFGRPMASRTAQRDPSLASASERLLASGLDWLVILTGAFLVQAGPILRIWRQMEAVLANAQNLGQAAAQTAFNDILQEQSTRHTIVIFWLVAFGIALAYYLVQHAAWGATLGKRAVGLRVVSAADSTRISVRAAGIRTAFFLLGPVVYLLVPYINLIGGVLWLADGFTLLWDPRKRCLHDRVAGTVVIRKR
jgi:uncharacterized RDD family membrane protein YckC